MRLSFIQSGPQMLLGTRLGLDRMVELAHEAADYFEKKDGPGLQSLFLVRGFPLLHDHAAVAIHLAVGLSFERVLDEGKVLDVAYWLFISPLSKELGLSHCMGGSTCNLDSASLGGLRMIGMPGPGNHDISLILDGKFELGDVHPALSDFLTSVEGEGEGEIPEEEHRGEISRKRIRLMEVLETLRVRASEIPETLNAQSLFLIFSGIGPLLGAIFFRPSELDAQIIEKVVEILSQWARRRPDLFEERYRLAIRFYSTRYASFKDILTILASHSADPKDAS